MLPAIAGFKFKGNSAGQQNWTAAKLPFRGRFAKVSEGQLQKSLDSGI
jgi:hypothetical protein